jgi:hypothetical protein
MRLPLQRVALRAFGTFGAWAHGLRRGWLGDRRPGVFVLVEGTYDIEFLRRISAILHAANPAMPSLAEMERRLELIFVPFGGGDLALWTFRLAGSGRAEFHLYDRDTAPESASRQRLADVVNLRPGCRAFLTGKRSLENYLDSTAVFEAGQLPVAFTDDDYLPDLVARLEYEQRGRTIPWHQLPARTRKRRHNHAKRWLNTAAVDRMTAERLARRDPEGEVCSWLRTIARLAAYGRP